MHEICYLKIDVIQGCRELCINKILLNYLIEFLLVINTFYCIINSVLSKVYCLTNKWRILIESLVMLIGSKPLPLFTSYIVFSLFCIEPYLMKRIKGHKTKFISIETSLRSAFCFQKISSEIDSYEIRSKFC